MTRWMTVLVLAALFAVLPAAHSLAHEGHAYKAMGVVIGVQQNQVSVRDKDGKISTHAVNAKTRIRRGRATVAIADVKVGDRIVVTWFERKDKAGKLTKDVTQVDLGVAPARR